MTLPSHVSELISLLQLTDCPEQTLLSFLHYLPCDPYLHSIYLELSYDPTRAEFAKLPSTEAVLSLLKTEYSSISVPCRRSFSDISETSSDKNRQNKGLKILSARVKSILQHKKMRSYKEVAEELIKDLNIETKSEEKNILRRVYDALNVLIAAGVVWKKDREYCWRGIENTNFSLKKRKLEQLVDKFIATKALVLQKENPVEFPLIFIATQGDDNSVSIETNKDYSAIRLKSEKEMKIFKEIDVISKCLESNLRSCINTLTP